MDDKTIICINCESEYTVDTVYSDGEVRYCPFCGTEHEEDSEVYE